MRTRAPAVKIEEAAVKLAPPEPAHQEATHRVAFIATFGVVRQDPTLRDLTHQLPTPDQQLLPQLNKHHPTSHT